MVVLRPGKLGDVVGGGLEDDDLRAGTWRDAQTHYDGPGVGEAASWRGAGSHLATHGCTWPALSQRIGDAEEYHQELLLLKWTQVKISISSVPLLGAHEPVLAEDDRRNGGWQPVHSRAKTSGAAGSGDSAPARGSTAPDSAVTRVWASSLIRHLRRRPRQPGLRGFAMLHDASSRSHRGGAEHEFPLGFEVRNRWSPTTESCILNPDRNPQESVSCCPLILS